MAQAPTVEDVERAEALLASGQGAAAVTMLERMAFSNPEHGRVWQLLTAALLQAHEFERAAITSYAFEALAPSPLAYLLRGKALLHVEPHEALTPALAAQAATPDSWEAQVLVARAYLVGRDATQAGLAAARRAVELAPDNAETHTVLALALRRHENFVDAESSASRALTLDHRNQEARDLLDGLALMRPRSGDEQASARNGKPRTALTAALVIICCVLIGIPVVLLLVGWQTAYVSAMVVAGLMVLLALLLRQRSSSR